MHGRRGPGGRHMPQSTRSATLDAGHAAPGAEPDPLADQVGARRRLAAPDRLRAFFAPRSIALVGASDSSGWGQFIVSSLATSGFTGPLRPVHPTRPRAFDRATVPSLRDLD